MLADVYGHRVLLLVRHGETAANVDGLMLGRADPPLTDRGVAQARALAAVLPTPDRVIASPLRRALDTAAAFGSNVEVDPRWIELDYGELDGRPLSSVPVEMWERWRSDPSVAPEGGEPLAVLGRRVREACADLVPDAATGVVVVVTHVSPIKAAVAWALAARDEVAWHMYVEDAGRHGSTSSTHCGGRQRQGPLLLRRRVSDHHWLGRRTTPARSVCPVAADRIVQADHPTLEVGDLTTGVELFVVRFSSGCVPAPQRRPSSKALTMSPAQS